MTQPDVLVATRLAVFSHLAADRHGVAAPSELHNEEVIPVVRSYDIDTLRRRVESGWRPKLLLFWGHTPKDPAQLGRECLSQWYPARFSVQGTEYPSTEHFMMAEKARLFGDTHAASQIAAAPHPRAAKELGRSVLGFDEQVWQANRFRIVVEGNIAKFSQNPPLRDFLLRTRERILVEASPVDRIWGIGLAARDPAALDPLQWRGLNLLGFALMEARERITDIASVT